MSEIDRANKALAILDNPVYAESFQMVRAAIIDRIERCPLAETQTAEDLRRCLRLLNDVKLNLEVAVKQGKVASFRLEQDKQRKENPLRNLFR